MTKKEKERQEKIKYLQKIVDKDIEYDTRKEYLVLSYIFNILASNTVRNRYGFSRYESLEEDRYYNPCAVVKIYLNRKERR